MTSLCSPEEAVRCLTQRLSHPKPAVQILALKLAETLMKNLDFPFHKLVIFSVQSTDPGYIYVGDGLLTPVSSRGRWERITQGSLKL